MKKVTKLEMNMDAHSSGVQFDIPKKDTTKKSIIREMILKYPSRKDATIAKKLKCHYGYVWAVRKDMQGTAGDDANLKRHVLAEELTNANAVQVGGAHYKDKTLQPWDAIIAWDMGFLDGNALKYLVRFRDKGGVEDLKKARHYIDKLIEVEGAK